MKIKLTDRHRLDTTTRVKDGRQWIEQMILITPDGERFDITDRSPKIVVENGQKFLSWIR